MAALIPITDFTVCVSASDWGHWPDEYGPTFSNPSLQAALEALEIKLNLVDLYHYYFDDIAVGQGDMLVFTSSRYTETWFITNLYQGLTDQQDCVQFYLHSPHQKLIEQIRPLLRHFFEQASSQISYTESCYSTAVHNIVEKQSGDLWEVVKESGYAQKVLFHSGNFAD